ncbi:MAG: DUF2971 domain-containing protein [Thermodesulfobacteriota bacterium]
MPFEIIRRYTDLPSLIYILKMKKITLLNPATWDDKNDSYFLDVYKKKKRLSCVLAMCLSEAPETYHHWKIFSGNNSGICIRFKKSLLLHYVDGEAGIRHGPVMYKLMNEIRKSKPTIDDLPFVKRYGFRDEVEYRIIYEDKNKKLPTKDIDIDLNCIHKIVLSPWMPKAIVPSVKELIKSISGCSSINIFATGINENREWKRIGDSL